MNRASVFTVLLAGLLSVPNWAQKSSQADLLFESARQKETLEGDPKGAIREYEEIVKRHSSDREVAAKALLAMAECHQKLGDGEARAIYERVLREYADQKQSVALARARLGGSGSATRAKGDRPVWTGPKVDGFGTSSPDGRLLTYTDWSTGGLVLRDLVAGTDRRLTPGSWAEGQTQFSAISRDAKQVAYQWCEHRRSQRTAQRICSGAVCRHLKIAGRIAFFTISSGYQPRTAKVAAHPLEIVN